MASATVRHRYKQLPKCCVTSDNRLWDISNLRYPSSLSSSLHSSQSARRRGSKHHQGIYYHLYPSRTSVEEIPDLHVNRIFADLDQQQQSQSRTIRKYSSRDTAPGISIYERLSQLKNQNNSRPGSRIRDLVFKEFTDLANKPNAARKKAPPPTTTTTNGNSTSHTADKLHHCGDLNYSKQDEADEDLPNENFHHPPRPTTSFSATSRRSFASRYQPSLRRGAESATDSRSSGRVRNMRYHLSPSNPPPFLQQQQQQQQQESNDETSSLSGSTISSINSGVSLYLSNSNSNQQQQQQQCPPPLQIEISPDHFVPVRGAQETSLAILNGQVRATMCTCCCPMLELYCIISADYVLCPQCRVVSPVDFLPQQAQARLKKDADSYSSAASQRKIQAQGGGGGVGLGLTLAGLQEELRRQQHQQQC
jgi:hypothetical protein